MAGELRGASWLQCRHQAVSAEVPGGRWRRKDMSVIREGEMFPRALFLARERTASRHLRLGMLRAVQPSSAPCEREECLSWPWSWLGCLAQGPTHGVWWWREAGRDSLFYLLLQVHWEESHFRHGDCGGVPTVWIRAGSRIPDVCKKPVISMVIWCQWDYPCPRRGCGCIGRCCLSLS